MKIINCPLEGCYLLKENVIEDKRGYFSETFNYNFLKEKINSDFFVQENESFSRKKVIRGMHYQKYPHSQDKLIRVLSGKIWDIVIDLRPDSSSYLKKIPGNQPTNAIRWRGCPSGKVQDPNKYRSDTNSPLEQEKEQSILFIICK